MADHEPVNNKSESKIEHSGENTTPPVSDPTTDPTPSTPATISSMVERMDVDRSDKPLTEASLGRVVKVVLEKIDVGMADNKEASSCEKLESKIEEKVEKTEVIKAEESSSEVDDATLTSEKPTACMEGESLASSKIDLNNIEKDRKLVIVAQKIDEVKDLGRKDGSSQNTDKTPAAIADEIEMVAEDSAVAESSVRDLSPKDHEELKEKFQTPSASEVGIDATNDDEVEQSPEIVPFASHNIEQSHDDSPAEEKAVDYEALIDNVTNESDDPVLLDKAEDLLQEDVTEPEQEAITQKNVDTVEDRANVVDTIPVVEEPMDVEKETADTHTTEKETENTVVDLIEGEKMDVETTEEKPMQKTVQETAVESADEKEEVKLREDSTKPATSDSVSGVVEKGKDDTMKVAEITSKPETIEKPVEAGRYVISSPPPTIEEESSKSEKKIEKLIIKKTITSPTKDIDGKEEKKVEKLIIKKSDIPSSEIELNTKEADEPTKQKKTKKLEKLTIKLDPSMEPQVKILRSPEAEVAVKSLQDEIGVKSPILNIPIVKSRESSVEKEERGEKRSLSSPTGSPTKKSRSAGLDSIVGRLKTRQTEPLFVVPGAESENAAQSPQDSPLSSPTKTATAPLSPKSPPGQRRTPPKSVLDEYAKMPAANVTSATLDAANPKSPTPKSPPPPAKSPPPTKSPFKSPLSPGRAGLATVSPNFIQPKVASVSPLGSPNKQQTSPTAISSTKPTTTSEPKSQVMSFKEHLDALVTKELISSHDGTVEKLDESNVDESMDTSESKPSEQVEGTENGTDNQDEEQAKCHKRKPKHLHKRRGKQRPPMPPRCHGMFISTKPKVTKVDAADDNAMDVPDPDAVSAATTTDGETADDDTSQDASRSSRSQKTPRKMAACSTLEDLGKTQDEMGNAVFLADNVYEYQWPPDEKEGEWSVIQEQVSEYLGIKSFKRKYPNMTRRLIVMKERNFLQDKGVVTETQCDLGLTALLTEEVLDLMAQDYPTKYKEFTAVLKERQRQRLVEKRKAAELLLTDKTKLAEMRKKAVKSASEFNSIFMRERREERRAYLDMQTLEVHYPKGKLKALAPECTQIGAYPVALIPGQFAEYYKRYTSSEMKYLPMNTVLYPAPRRPPTIYADPSLDAKYDTDSDDNASSSSSESENDDPPPTLTLPMEVRDVTESPAPEKASVPEPEVPAVKVKVCKVCQESDENKPVTEEPMLTCSECGASGHRSCLELTASMVKLCRTYPWQCMECKTCVECMDPGDEEQMMFCDRCDRGYHTFCLGVKAIPTGRWECPSCKPRDTPTKKPRDTPTKIPKKRGRKPKPKDSEALAALAAATSPTKSPEKPEKPEKPEQPDTPSKAEIRAMRTEKREKEKNERIAKMIREKAEKRERRLKKRAEKLAKEGKTKKKAEEKDNEETAMQTEDVENTEEDEKKEEEENTEDIDETEKGHNTEVTEDIENNEEIEEKTMEAEQTEMETMETE